MTKATASVCFAAAASKYVFRPRSVVAHQAMCGSLIKPAVGLAKLPDKRLKAIDGKVAAGQRRATRPAWQALAENGLDTVHDGPGEAAVGGDLATEDIEQHAISSAAVLLDHIVTRGFLRFGSAVIKQGSHTGIGPHHIVRFDGLAKVFTGRTTQISHLVRRDFRLAHGAVMVCVGGADQRVVMFVGNGEDDAPVSHSGRCSICPWSNSLPTTIWLPRTSRTLCASLCPNTSLSTSSTQGPAALTMMLAVRLERSAGCGVFNLDVPSSSVAAGRHNTGSGTNVSAPVGGIAGIQNHQSRIFHPAIGILEGLAEQRLERASGGVTS
jgi:hypothetical protein